MPEAQGQLLRLAARHVYPRLKHIGGREPSPALQKRFAARGQAHDGVLAHAGGIDAYARGAVFHLQPQGRVQAGVLDRAHLLVGHEGLGEGLFLIGLEPGEVRLVVGIHAGHQLDVGAVLVGEVAVPGLPEIAAAPGPLLLAGGDVMVGDVQNARLHAVIVSAHEIVVRMIGHVGRGHGDVLVAGDVHARAVVVFVIGAGSDGEA